MSDPSNKTELLAKMRAGYDAFEALLAPLSSEQLSTPGVNGEWAAKDILVHLTVWQDRVSTRLESIARQMDAPLDPIENDEKMNAFNDSTFEANRMRPANEVLADFRAAVKRLDANVEAMDERDLFEAGRFPWLAGGLLWQGIEGNTYGHYEEHMPMIERWLAGQHA